MSDEESASKPARQLLQDGKWLVPISERPANWQSILPEEESATAASATPAADTPAQVAAAATAAPEQAAEAPAPAPSTDLVVRQSTDMRNVQVSATSAAAVPHLQAELLAWSRQKLKLVRQEAKDLAEAHERAVKSKWNPHALKRAADNAAKRVIYYKKVLAALEAGYCLFPTGSLDLFAVRTGRRRPDRNERSATSEHSWGPADPLSGHRTAEAQSLPPGAGRYVSTEVITFEQFDENTVTGKDGQQKKGSIGWWWNQDFEDVEFPLDLAKPELVKVTSEAMALKLFDEIGVLRLRPDDVQSARADPVILGRIIYPIRNNYRQPRRLTFLIGWYVDTGSL